MRLASLVVAGGLFASAAQGATLIDFGTNTGQTNSPGTPGFSVWGGYGFAHTRNFTADSVNISYSPTGAWTNAGEQYRGTFFNGLNLNNVDTTGKIAFESRIILGTPAPDFYLYTITLIAVDGSTSRYDLIGSVRTNPTPFSYGTNPASVPFTVVEATTTLANPVSVAGGGFAFGTDVLAGIDLLYQAAVNGSGSFTMEIDSIQVPLVPEPVSAGVALAATPLLLRRRRV